MAQGSRFVDPNFNGGGLFDPRLPGVAYPEPIENVPYVENAGLSGGCGCAGVSGLGKSAMFDKKAMLAKLRRQNIEKLKENPSLERQLRSLGRKLPIRMSPANLAELRGRADKPYGSSLATVKKDAVAQDVAEAQAAVQDSQVPEQIDIDIDGALQTGAKVAGLYLVGSLALTGLIIYAGIKLAKGK